MWNPIIWFHYLYRLYTKTLKCWWIKMRNAPLKKKLHPCVICETGPFSMQLVKFWMLLCMCTVKCTSFLKKVTSKSLRAFFVDFLETKAISNLLPNYFRIFSYVLISCGYCNKFLIVNYCSSKHCIGLTIQWYFKHPKYITIVIVCSWGYQKMWDLFL